MTSSYDLTTEQGLRDYLAATRSENTSVKLLTGGTANYVYRATRQDGSTSIFKHAAPYLHSNKDFAFDPARMDYEAHVLEALSLKKTMPERDPSRENLGMHAVELLGYDQEKKLLEIEDGGSRNLKEAYTDMEFEIPNIGRKLGIWLSLQHTFFHGFLLELPDLDRSGNKNNDIAVKIYRYSYNGLHTALEQFGHDTQLAHRANEEFGSLLATDDETVCHGDFWPGNVLVRPRTSRSTELTIVDWEMVRRGTTATDVAQFAAEAFLLDRFRGGKGLLPPFLRAYIHRRVDMKQPNKAWVRRMVVHWAVHVAFWPTRVEWADKEETKKLVDIGVAALEAVLANDWEKVLELPLFKEVKEVFVQVLQRP